jgi:DNA-binding FrmR family transcriptional regulator
MSPETADAAGHPLPSASGGVKSAHGYSSQKENYAKRLRRIEGQVRGIAKMIDEDKYCIDILTQISAVNSALRSVALNLLNEHLGHCVSRAVADGGSEADEKLAEASAAIARLVRS